MRDFLSFLLLRYIDHNYCTWHCTTTRHLVIVAFSIVIIRKMWLTLATTSHPLVHQPQSKRFRVTLRRQRRWKSQSGGWLGKNMTTIEAKPQWNAPCKHSKWDIKPLVVYVKEHAGIPKTGLCKNWREVRENISQKIAS